MDKDEAGTVILPDMQLQDVSVARKVVEISPAIGQRLVGLVATVVVTLHEIERKQLPLDESAANDQAA